MHDMQQNEQEAEDFHQAAYYTCKWYTFLTTRHDWLWMNSLL